MPLVSLAAAFAIAAAASRWLSSHPALLDRPNARSLHATPVPRSGGIGVLAGILLPLLVGAGLGYVEQTLVWIAVAALLVAGVSLRDDIADVPARVRLAIHVASVVLLMLGGLVWTTLDLPGLGWRFPVGLDWFLTLLFGVWMINLFNFMDGMDGFAGGMAAIGFAALALLGWQGGDPLYAAAAGTIAAASAGFLTSNFPPARIFLGDVGSSTLGLLAAAFSLWGSARGLFPLWAAWLIFSVFIVDATWTLLRRLIAGERVWEAHRSHHYQRLVLAGWGHRRTVLRAYAVMVAAALCAIAGPGLDAAGQWFLILVWAGIYAAIGWRVRLAEQGAGEGAR